MNTESDNLILEKPVISNGEDKQSDTLLQKQKKPGFFAKFKKKKDEKPEEEKAPSVKYSQLFRYSTRSEKIMMFIAIVSAVIHGAIQPMFTVFFGEIINSFSPTTPQDEIVDEVGSYAKWFLVLGAVAFVFSYIQVHFQLIVAQNICTRLRQKYFESLMSQDYAWYDQNDGGELTTRVAGDVDIIQKGIGDKFTTAVQYIAMFITGLIIAFVTGPLLTLVILSVSPLIAVGGALFGKFATESTETELGAYGEAGGIATEVIGLIRIVTAYNGQAAELKRYEEKLESAYKSGVKKAMFIGLGLGFTMFVIFCTYAVAFAFGATRVRKEDNPLEAGDLMTTFFAVFIAAISIGQAASTFSAFTAAQGAAPRVYEVIERQSEIHPLNDDDGDVLENFKGVIGLNNVNFNYPNRMVDDLEDKDARPYILHNFNLSVPSGTTHALVGSSGCGKSTTARLIERFYDTQEGSVTFDGVDVKNLNVKWLRSQIGYVGQMPTLFMLSIRDNIALGAPVEMSVDEKTGKRVFKRREVTMEEIEQAAKMANAHDFIMKLPEKYDTMLGERGALLSGGQKQRVCIARALIRNPKIIILDEATAALDAQSERIVQKALEKASEGRTTLTIAHRLSTVKNADVISVIDKGSVIESGQHASLMEKEGGAYRALVEHQAIEALKAKDEKEQDAEMGAIGAKQKTKIKSSVTKTSALALQEEEEEKSAVDKGITRRAFKWNAKELPFILLGMVGAAAAGASFPISAIVLSDALDELLTEGKDADVTRYCLYYVAVGGAAFFGNLFQLWLLGISGERLTRKARKASFAAILKQDMGFFDDKENALGALTTRLATEASAMKGLTGDTLGTLTFSLAAIATGALVAYLSCWRVALVVTTVFPLMGIAGALQMKMMSGFDADSSSRYAQAGAVASEAVDNIDTVNAIGVQDYFIEKYDLELEKPLRNGFRSGLIGGLSFGFSEFISLSIWAICLWIGSIFVRNGQCDFNGLMKAVTGLLFGGIMIGNATQTAPDMVKAKVGATKIFRLIDRESKIDPTTDAGVKTAITGNVDANDLRFEYPTRPDVRVLKGLSFKVSRGQTLALVGGSGCGKSTVVSLLERYYDPRTGHINVDGTEIKDYEVKWMRKHVGFVSQEPDLFNRSVRDNIAYGLDHEDGTPVTDDMIIQAAKAANAHDFISDLDDGYDTLAGSRGNRLSGGQRQRVAIARAIVRNPGLLLLDEATSALDAVSERVVQDALDKAGAGRTTIAIAHRLSTVKDADCIAVVANGRIAESGTHNELLRKNGEYAALIQNQLTGGDEDEA